MSQCSLTITETQKDIFTEDFYAILMIWYIYSGNTDLITAYIYYEKIVIQHQIITCANAD